MRPVLGGSFHYNNRSENRPNFQENLEFSYHIPNSGLDVISDQNYLINVFILCMLIIINKRILLCISFMVIL